MDTRTQKFVAVALINLWMIPWIISTLVVAREDCDNPCQGKDVIILSLCTYLNVYGITSFGLVGVLDMFAAGGYECLCAVCSALLFMFHMAWFMVGLTFLRPDSACTNDAPIGRMTFAVLMSQAIEFIVLLCVAIVGTNRTQH